MGKGGVSNPLLFLFVKTIEKVIRLIILVVALKVWAFFTYFNLVLMEGGYIYP